MLIRIPTRVLGVLTVILTVTIGLAHAEDNSFIGKLNKIKPIASTVPANGDLNPYGVARVPRTEGLLRRGNILVSNFNNSANQQGTGTTIIEIAPNGTSLQFAQIDPKQLPGSCPGGIGLTTALAVLRNGWVIVGSLPTSDGTAATAQAGCLLVLDSKGKVVETLTDPLINGPWDLTAVEAEREDSENEEAQHKVTLFVTNVLNGTVAASPNLVKQGTVIRIVLNVSKKEMPHVLSTTVIGSDFPERTDPNALVIGPTGLALGRDDILYVADSLNNRIAAIPDALSRPSTASAGLTVSIGGSLNDPLGLAIAPNGDILTANGNDGNLVETTPNGNQLATKLLDNTGTPPGAGTLFGLAVVRNQGVYFVDDGNNTLNLLTKDLNSP